MGSAFLQTLTSAREYHVEMARAWTASTCTHAIATRATQANIVKQVNIMFVLVISHITLCSKAITQALGICLFLCACFGLYARKLHNKHHLKTCPLHLHRY